MTELYPRLASTSMYLMALVVVVAAVATAAAPTSMVLLALVAAMCTVAVGREVRRDDALSWTVLVSADAATICVVTLPWALDLSEVSWRPVWVAVTLYLLSGFGLLVAAARALAAR